MELTKTRSLQPKTTQEETQREEEFQSVFFSKKRLNIGRTADNAEPRGKKDPTNPLRLILKGFFDQMSSVIFSF